MLPEIILTRSPTKIALRKFAFELEGRLEVDYPMTLKTCFKSKRFVAEGARMGSIVVFSMSTTKELISP